MGESTPKVPGILKFDVFQCGDIDEASSADGFLYRFASSEGNVKYYACEKAPGCPARVVLCYDGQGIRLVPHSGHEPEQQEEEACEDVRVNGGKAEVGEYEDQENTGVEWSGLYPDLEEELRSLNSGQSSNNPEEEVEKVASEPASTKPSESLENGQPKINEGICVVKISLPFDSPSRKSLRFNLAAPPTLEQMIRKVYEEHASRFDGEETVRAAVLDWMPDEEEHPLDVAERVQEWSRYEFLLFCDNRIIEKSLIIKGNAEKGAATLQLLLEDSDLPRIEKHIDFDLSSPVNLYESLQTHFDEHFRGNDCVTSDVVQGAIFRFDPESEEFEEVDEREDFFENNKKYRFVYYNGNAPSSAYVVYERVITMDYATNDPISAVLDNNNYARKTTSAFCDEPRPSVTKVLNLICPKRCTSENRQWRCFVCRKIVHFDGLKRFYCSCGGWIATSTSFRCSNHLHVSSIGFVSFNNFATMEHFMKPSGSTHSRPSGSTTSGPRSTSFKPSQLPTYERVANRGRTTPRDQNQQRREQPQPQRRGSSSSIMGGIQRAASKISREFKDVFKL